MDFKLHERINKAIFHATNSTLPLWKKFRGKWRLTKMLPSHNFVAFTQFGPLSIFKKDIHFSLSISIAQIFVSQEYKSQFEAR